MELERCRTVLKIAELNNLSLAAKELGYTVSGASRALAAMESELGFKLFHRLHDGLEPTKECLRILPKIRDFVFSGELCLQLAASISELEVGAVTVGCAYNAYYGSLAELISSFRASHPGITLTLRHGSSSELARDLREHRLDMCLISKRDGIDSWYPLCADELTAWVPTASPLSALDAVPLSAFESEAYIDILFDPDSESNNSILFARHGIRPNTQFCVSDSLSGYCMVEAGLGIAMNNALNGHGFDGKVRIMPLSPPSFVEIGIATLRDMTPAASAFLDFIKQNDLNPRK